MADGGGINLRLSLKGAEEVRAGLTSLGPAGSKAMRELDRAMTPPTAGLRALDSAVSQARGGLEGFAARGGAAGSVLQSFGPWGVAAAAGFAAVAVGAAAALRIANEATAAAAALTDTSERIGIGTEALQKWRYAADEAGVPIASLEAGMEKLNGVLGAFKMGLGDAKLKPVFEELGITQSELDTVSTADDMLLLLSDTLGQVQDRASQVKLAKTLQIEELLPLLRQGSAGIETLMADAEALGVVLDADVVKRLDEADRKAELAGQQLKTMAYAAVEPLASSLAELGSGFAGLLNDFDRITAKGPDVIQMFRQISASMPAGQKQAFEAGAALSMRWLGVKPEAGPTFDRKHTGAGVASLAELQALAAGEPGSGFQPRGHASGGGGGGSSGPSAAEREAEQRRKEAEREIERVRKAEIDAGRDYLRNLVQRGLTAEERAQSARLLNESEAAEQAWQDDLLIKKIEAAGLMTDEVRARIENIAGIKAAMRADAETRRLAEEAKATRKAMASADEEHLRITVEMLDLASYSARTADEKRAIELNLLDIAQRRQRADLESAIAAEKEPAARARLVEALDRLPALFEAQAHAVRRDTAGPVEGWWNDQRSSGQARDFVQGEALSALDGMNKGLIDAWANAESASDALDRMGQVGVDALGRIRDALMEVALQRMVIQPLINGLFGDGKSGSGLLGGLLEGVTGAIFGGTYGIGAKGGGAIPNPGAYFITPGKLSGARGFANGGLNGSAGGAFVGERGIEFVDMPVGARIHDTHRTEQMMRDAMARQAQGFGGSAPAAVNMPITLINRTSEPVSARTRQTPDGIEVLLEPMVRGAVRKMGSDGSLAKAHGLTPRGIDR